MMVNVTIVIFVVSIGLYFIACVHHFRIMLANLSETADKNPSTEMKFRMKCSIIAAVNFHQTNKK